MFINIIAIFLVFIQPVLLAKPQLCDKKDIFTLHPFSCSLFTVPKPLYILYDINPGEGFNLRRDVFIRLATFVKKVRLEPGFEETKLVLPPWTNLYHWRSYNINQEHIFWGQFFDLTSMKRYTKVLDMYEFFHEWSQIYGNQEKLVIDEVYKLRHFDDMFENGVFLDKFEEKACTKKDNWGKNYFGYQNITENKLTCLCFQGSASLIHKLLIQRMPKDIPFRLVLFLNAETILHDHWGNEDYWEARRSMRFNGRLVEIADRFRLDYFNSTNINDKVQRPQLWTDERPFRKAKGGEYLAAHLRRADFLYGREKTTPSLHSAAIQIKTKLLELGLRKVFIASDCSKSEFHDLKNYLKRYKLVRYKPESYSEKNDLKDGGVAIIDQIICSHARYFMGTYESTFTYRIYEEREILGFPKDLTFNTFCKNDDLTSCEKNSVWPIVY